MGKDTRAAIAASASPYASTYGHKKSSLNVKRNFFKKLTAKKTPPTIERGTPLPKKRVRSEN